MNFNNKTIWITGASSGIGKAFAIEVSKYKTQLILSSRNKEKLEDVANSCRKNNCKTYVIPMDMSDEKSIDSALIIINKNKIKIDGLFQFAGISQRSLVTETPIILDRKIFETNFFGIVYLTKLVLPLMIENGGGQIAVTSSIVGKFGFPYRSAYSAAKHALHGFFESLRAENKGNNILVSIIIPGRVKTNISLNALSKDGKERGIMDEGINNGISAEKSAKIIYKGLKKNRKEILVGGKELLMVHIRRFFPALYYNLSSKIKPT